MLVWDVAGMIVGDSGWIQIVALGDTICWEGNWGRRWQGRHRNDFSMFGWIFWQNVVYSCEVECVESQCFT